MTGRREPNFTTLLKLCEVLATSPNDLLGFPQPDPDAVPDADMRAGLYGELRSAASALSDDDLRLVTRQVAAVLEFRRQG